MPITKKKSKKLSLVPKRTEQNMTSNYTIESIRNSLTVAEQADNHYPHAFHAQRDVNLTKNWEALPIYNHGDHLPKMELFKNFKRTVNKVL
ncbi:MAG: hypothetical protein GY852_08375 [bacterium]|nr:hypothetical protein [bacterium]